MKTKQDHTPMSRRGFVQTTSALAASALVGGLPGSASAQPSASPRPEGCPVPRPLLTPAGKFEDVSRGEPLPHTLQGSALVEARLTPETWRLEVMTDDRPNPAIPRAASISRALTLANGTALDLPALLELGQKHEVRYIKAMQCLNIPNPLGQGLWEGVPLRDVLRLCGTMRDVRRVYYWGFHNHDPKQLFQSSLSYTQVMETAPGDLPAFLAYRLNGEPITLERGGPVRLIVPWAHGFKSIKWLQRIVLTNDYQANDTYALQNNDPESHLKTAAYLDELPAQLPTARAVWLSGQVISGLSGLARVEYSIVRDGAEAGEGNERWLAGELEDPPADWSSVLPSGVSPRTILGFDPATGRPATWPLRYGMVSWSASLGRLAPGKYTARVRAVDLNGFAQPEPRPLQKTGRNSVELREFEVV